MRIIVDAMGGDHAPQEIVRGALEAHALYGCEIILVGKEEEIRAASGELPSGVSIRNAREVVEICDDPATAFKRKKDSSLTVGLNLLRDGEGDAFVSAGSTGALLAAATLLVKRIRGVRRAAMAPLIPTATGSMLLCDCGANAECTVEYLTQFAYLASIYAEKVLGREKPRVALLNIGTEPSKGDTLRKETYAALTEAAQDGSLNFIGNMEPKEAMQGGADVLVADGFSGNVMLKTVEGVASFMGKRMKQMFLKSVKTKLAALLIKGGLDEFKAQLDPNKVGGTAILGIVKPVIKAHGSSNAEAICNAIRQAAENANADVAGEMSRYLSEKNSKNVQSPIDSE